MKPEMEVEYISNTCVRLTCLLEASAERIYRAWITPSEVVQWFAPPGAMCEVSEMDVRVGGRYTMTMVLPGARHVMTGKYLALEPNRLIKFTWAGTCGIDEGVVSEVAVELTPVNGRTRLALTHDRLAHAASRDQHAQGWIGCLTGLSRYAANP